jgi:hypothetical protein
MAARRPFVLILLGALASLGAQYRTQNFLVEAPTPQIAQQVGQYAEHYRREKALQWLGYEMPPWPEPCPLRVTITMNGSSGATSFAFDRGHVLGMDMHIEGTHERLLNSVLPHEVTHTVFAHYYRTPVPRWADEGGSVLSEDDLERGRHDALVRNILNTPGRMIPLRRLFTLSKYPNDVMVLYAEGYSVSDFLVGLSDRPTFLRFVAQGMRGDWDGAARSYYRFNSVEDLERGWIQHLRDTPPARLNQLASNRSGTEGDPARRVVVRTTVPPAQPLLDGPKPVYRGTAGDTDDGGGAPGRTTSATRPGYLPEVRSPESKPAQARLGAPQIEAPVSAPAAQLGAPVFPGSPVGYPR